MHRTRVRPDLELAWDEMGQGIPLLLVMGIGAQRIMWPQPFCEALAARGFRVIRYDHRDVGQSTQLSHLGRPPVLRNMAARLVGAPIEAPYTLRDMAGDAVALLDALGIESAHVVGASLGGMVAQEMAIGWPSHMRSLVSLMSSAGRRRDAIGDPRALLALLDPPAPGEEGYVEHFVALMGRFAGEDEIDEAALRATATELWRRRGDPVGFLRHLAAVLASGDRTAELREVRVPTLVLHGTADPLIPPRAGRTTARAIPGARLRWIQGMGHHMPASRWPELVDAISEHALGAERERADPPQSERHARVDMVP